MRWRLSLAMACAVSLLRRFLRVARGLAAYDVEDARRIAGHRSEALEDILGWRGRDEIVHRDDLVLMP